MATEPGVESASIRIVITECDHDAIDIEREVARQRGVGLELFQAKTIDQVVAAAHDADGIVVQYATITEAVLQSLPRLKVIGRYGVGVDTVDVAAATRHGVAVCNVPDYGTEDVSDHAIALATGLARGLPRLDHRLRHGSTDLTPARPLHRFGDLTFGLIGVGRIGSATGRKAAGLGFSVIGFDPVRDIGETTAEGVQMVSFDEVIERSDIVSLHVPLTPQTAHLIDDAVFARLRTGALLINTCRGGVVDTEALVRALEQDRLAGAGLDVLEVEPPEVDHPLMGFDNVVLTPHAAWYTEESYQELKRRVVENVIDVCQGITPRNVLNPEVLG